MLCLLSGMEGRSAAEDFNAIREAAESGNIYAQYQLGIMYYEGNGVNRDYTGGCKMVAKGY
ncbi:MAG: hypothetical protein R2941_19105 [Desulfobacterales bacterium]